MTAQEKAVEMVINERARQAALWGTEPVMVERHGFRDYLFTKMVILMEEVGEASKDILDGKHEEDDFITEFVQFTAVGLAIIEGILYAQSEEM